MDDVEAAIYRKQQPLDIGLFAPVRSSDPQTSHDAAERITPTRGTQMAHALAILQAHPAGLTPKEVERYSGKAGIWKRMSDLKRAGLAKGTGVVRDGGEVYVAV